MSRRVELAVKYGRPNRDATMTNGRCSLLLKVCKETARERRPIRALAA